MRASGVSELRKYLHFHILKRLFLSIFVRTADTLSVQTTCLSAYMYRQIFKCTDKTLKEPPPPPPPPGHASDMNYCYYLTSVIVPDTSPPSRSWSKTPRDVGKKAGQAAASRCHSDKAYIIIGIHRNKQYV